MLTLKQRRLTFPPVPALVAELRYHEYTLSRGGHVTLGAPDRAGAHDDLVTALALSLWVPEQQTEDVVTLEDLWSPDTEAQYERECVRIGQEPDWMRRSRGLLDIPGY